MRITGLIRVDKISSRRQLNAARVLFFLAEYHLVILLSVDNSSFLNNFTLKTSLRFRLLFIITKTSKCIFLKLNIAITFKLSQTPCGVTLNRMEGGFIVPSGYPLYWLPRAKGFPFPSRWILNSSNPPFLLLSTSCRVEKVSYYKRE